MVAGLQARLLEEMAGILARAFLSPAPPLRVKVSALSSAGAEQRGLCCSGRHMRRRWQRLPTSRDAQRDCRENAVCCLSLSQRRVRYCGFGCATSRYLGWLGRAGTGSVRYDLSYSDRWGVDIRRRQYCRATRCDSWAKSVDVVCGRLAVVTCEPVLYVGDCRVPSSH